MDYIFLQNYWWFLVSLLGALLVFLLFCAGWQFFTVHFGPYSRRAYHAGEFHRT